MSTYETRKARSEAANRAFYAFMDAYAEAIGEKPAIDDPETKAARRLAAEAFGFFTAYPATDDDRATVSAMVEAIADRARESAALAHYQTADAAARRAESFAEAAEWAADKIENDPAGDLAEWAHAARAFAAHAAEAANAARLICNYDRNTTFADYETSAYAANALEYIDMRAADAAAAADRAEEAAARAEEAARRAKADDAAARFCAALTEATGEVPYFEDAASVCKVARDDIAGEHRSTALDRDAVNLMTEAIADAARKNAAFRANQAANDAITDANRAYEEADNWQAFFIELAEKEAAEAARLAVVANDQTITAKAGAVSAMIKRVREEIAAAAPIYQRYELLAYLGEPDDYDVDAIEAEATAYDPKTGAQVWTAFGDDLAAIAERHEIVTYYAI